MAKPVHLIPSSSDEKFRKYIKPMLAKLYDEPFDDSNWIFEIKWDGYRAIAEINKKDIRLYSRNGLSFSHKYPIVFDALKTIKKNIVLDGEIVAFNKEGMPSFQLLQQYEQNNTVPLVYYVFDCLYVNGKSIENKPLLERKQILKDLLPENDFIKYCDHVEATGNDFFKLIKEQGLEGMIAKRADSGYIEGSRTSDWLKIKYMHTDEAIIVGYTEPRGGRKYFGALVLGVYKGDKLIYIGHTGTGFDQKTIKTVYEKMQPLVIDKSPFDTKIKTNMPVTWIKPELVCNLKFTEVTSDGNRRHPVFMGLRMDKAATEVTPDSDTSKHVTKKISTKYKSRSWKKASKKSMAKK